MRWSEAGKHDDIGITYLRKKYVAETDKSSEEKERRSDGIKYRLEKHVTETKSI